MPGTATAQSLQVNTLLIYFHLLQLLNTHVSMANVIGEDVKLVGVVGTLEKVV